MIIVITGWFLLASDGELKIIVQNGAYYSFNGNANDESTNSFDGTVSGLSLTTDYLGSEDNAYESTSDNNRITVNIGEVTGAFTVSFWLTIYDYSPYSGSNGNNGLIGHSTAYSTGGRISFASSSNSSIGVWVAGGSDTTISLTEGMPTNEAYMLTITRDSSDNLKVYKNGTDVTSGSPTLSGSIYFDILFDNPTDSSWTGLNGIGHSALIVMNDLSEDEVAHLYTVTSSHKLDKPLVTRTDSDGDSITGYELTGKIKNSDGASSDFNTCVELPSLGIAGDTTVAYYCKFMLSDDVESNGDQLICGRFGNVNSLGTSTAYPLYGILFLQDDISLVTTATLSRGKIYQVIASFEYDSGTPADSVWNVYVADADGTIVDSATRTGYDAYSASTMWLGYESRFIKQLRGVISKPIIFNRVFTSDERTKLFNGTIPYETISIMTR